MNTRQMALTGMALLLLLVGCVGLPPAPQSTREALGQAQIALQEVVAAALDLHDQGVTKPEQEQVLKGLFQDASAALEVATTLTAAGDDAAAQTEIDAARKLIQQARRALKEAEE
jgi:hypothetical protein